MTYAKARDKNETQIIKALEKMHALVWRHDTPFDLLGFDKITKQFFWIEVKNPERRGKAKNKQTKIQIEFLENTQGGLRTVVETVDEAIDFLNLVVRSKD